MERDQSEQAVLVPQSDFHKNFKKVLKSVSKLFFVFCVILNKFSIYNYLLKFIFKPKFL